MLAQTPAQKPTNSAAERPSDPDWAWAPYRPDDARPWNLCLAAHLYRRAGFGASWDRLQQALAAGPQAAVQRLVRPESEVPADEIAQFNRTFDEYEAAGGDSGSADSLRAWWLRRMLDTPHPLLEKMTLFWHGHFAASNAKVASTRLMRDHVRLLRSNALGRYGPLLEAVSRDPAMLIWLDCQANRRANPSQGLARAMMETFSLGSGNFSADDVHEAARAFTGWFVMRGRLRYIPREHDPGQKEILGRKGNFKNDDVVRIVLGQPAAPRLLVRKLFAWLISQTDRPADAIIDPLARSFAGGYDVAKLVETMLRSNLFFSSIAYRRRIKGPVEFALGIVKALEGTVSTAQLGQDLAALGQNLYHPPTVKGWPGGRNWINGSTLLGRANLARALLAGSEPYGDKLNPQQIAGRHGHSGLEPAGRFLLELLLQADVEAGVREKLLKTLKDPGTDQDAARRLRLFAHAVVTLPEFHLA